MNDLSELATEAHGGMARWNEFTQLRAEVSIDGAIWHVKQRPGRRLNKTFDIDTQHEWLSITPFPEAGQRSVFTADSLAFETLDAFGTGSLDRKSVV